MNLSPSIISRLTAIKSLLDLRDLELVAVASSRLEDYRGEQEIDEALSALEGHRFSEAAKIIEKILSDGTRLACWVDPEVALLDAEFEQVASELADLEAEQADLEHLMSRFQAAHNEALGTRISRLLKLRLRSLERQSKANPEKHSAYEQANRDFEDFQQDHELQDKSGVRTNWELSEDEQKELKSLFRKGSKLCHPDLNSPEHHDIAAEMFRDLRKTYDSGDLEGVRLLIQRCEAGLFDTKNRSGDSEDRRKERLKARVAGIREAIERTRASIQAIKLSSTYRTMIENPDWLTLFEKQGDILDKEIENLSATLDGETNDDA